MGLGRVHFSATRLDAEPRVNWRGMPAAIAAQLETDLAPAQMRRVDAFTGGLSRITHRPHAYTIAALIGADQGN